MADPRATAAGFLVEDFVTSITTQLDRVQDALRIKAVNRPLTYALKELHLELKVFVDMDAHGQVLLRAAGPNEAGASTLAMDFTTITKPMIEENTISLAATRSTPLDGLGLKPEEQMRLERLGVTNLAQLDRLKGSTGVNTVARLADVSVDRLRRALQAGVPRLGVGVPGPQPAPAMPAPRPAPPAMPTPRPAPPPVPPRSTQPPPRPGPVTLPPRPLPVTPRPVPVRPAPVFNRPGAVLRPSWLRQVEDQALAAAQAAQHGRGEPVDEPPYAAAQPPAPVLAVPPHSRSLMLAGEHLQHEAYPPRVLLNGQALDIEELDDDRLVVALPQGFEEGALEVQLGDQPAHTFALVHELVHEPAYTSPSATQAAQPDPWAPATGGRP